MSSIDSLLAELVANINFQRSAMSLTVVTGGAVITGTLVAAQDYHHAAANHLSSPAAGEAGGLASCFQQREAREDAARKADANDPNKPLEQPSYLHMRDAKVISGAHLGPKNGLWLRVRLDDVSAWSVESFSD